MGRRGARALLKEAGLKPNAREVVFFSADKGTEEVTHGRGNAKVEQHFARGMDDANPPCDPTCCWPTR